MVPVEWVVAQATRDPQPRVRISTLTSQQRQPEYLNHLTMGITDTSKCLEHKPIDYVALGLNNIQPQQQITQSKPIKLQIAANTQQTTIRSPDKRSDSNTTGSPARTWSNDQSNNRGSFLPHAARVFPVGVTFTGHTISKYALSLIHI